MICEPAAWFSRASLPYSGKAVLIPLTFLALFVELKKVYLSAPGRKKKKNVLVHSYNVIKAKFKEFHVASIKHYARYAEAQNCIVYKVWIFYVIKLGYSEAENLSLNFSFVHLSLVS